MGALMAEDDIYIGPLFDLFNLRFGPEQRDVEFDAGGVSEIKALQEEFSIFQEGRPFVESAKLLGLGGLGNNRAKNRWYNVLTWLAKVPSDQDGETGDQRIVNALIKNFGRKSPLPCFMKAHDSRDSAGYGLKVVVREDTPIFYIDRTYLTISVPMAPKVPPAGKDKKKSKKK
ncbi:hypothetical protein [Bradyrhizobium amphicarpaeae]|uniref:Uncharacterized protein n=1 Tax=Bradyrhizobium amphicarpaeae TaxID=1404768 RepID=A0A2U8PZY9_9BRAD|nr:hypothetical protein [Bradyrhizobium amphicarpaeae]AWM03252.1 hypothetical protein CIT40_26565 [Bradyrhizobium amphicarpaeae]